LIHYSYTMHRPLLVAILVSAASVRVSADTAAVLPFVNNSASAAQSNLDWIGESIAETLREALATRGVPTLERDEVQDAMHSLKLRERGALSEASVMKLGETLDAEQVVYGRFEFSPSTPAAGSSSRGSLRISARIVDLRRLRMEPEFQENGALEDLPVLEAHLTWRVLTQLAPKLAPAESDFRALRPSIRLDAEENYVRGLLARDTEQKEKYFIQAARLDARFAHPCYQLGRIHYQRKEFRQAVEWLEKVGPEDIHYRAANFLLGLARFQSGDYTGAQKAFQTILATVPLNEVYNDLGAAESRRNQPEAIDDFRKALEGDQNDPVYQFNVGYALWKKGDFTAAAEQFRAVLNRDPGDQTAAALLSRCLKKQGFRTGDAGSAEARAQGQERLKTNYEERAYWQLKSLLESKTP